MDPHADMNVIQRAFVEGGPVMYIILLIGLATVWIIVKRFADFANLLLDKKDFMDNIFCCGTATFYYFILLSIKNNKSLLLPHNFIR